MTVLQETLAGEKMNGRDDEAHLKQVPLRCKGAVTATPLRGPCRHIDLRPCSRPGPLSHCPMSLNPSFIASSNLRLSVRFKLSRF